jgi:hypothetical protein
MPRPQIQINERLVRTLAESQFTNADIAKACNCSPDTIERRFAGRLRQWKNPSNPQNLTMTPSLTGDNRLDESPEEVEEGARPPDSAAAENAQIHVDSNAKATGSEESFAAQEGGETWP